MLFKTCYLLFHASSVLEASKTTDNDVRPIDEGMIRSQDDLHKMEFDREEAERRMRYGNNAAYYKAASSGSSQGDARKFPDFQDIEDQGGNSTDLKNVTNNRAKKAIKGFRLNAMLPAQ